jgi:hypothetical protein
MRPLHVLWPPETNTTFYSPGRMGRTCECSRPTGRELRPFGRSILTVSDAYKWHDQVWQRLGWEYSLIYQLHLLRFSNRNQSLTPLQCVTEELESLWSLNLRGPHVGYARLSSGRGDLPVDGEFTCSWRVSRDSSYLTSCSGSWHSRRWTAGSAEGGRFRQ